MSSQPSAVSAKGPTIYYCCYYMFTVLASAAASHLLRYTKILGDYRYAVHGTEMRTDVSLGGGALVFALHGADSLCTNLILLWGYFK